MIMSVGYYFFFRKLPVLWRDVNKESFTGLIIIYYISKLLSQNWQWKFAQKPDLNFSGCEPTQESYRMTWRCLEMGQFSQLDAVVWRIHQAEPVLSVVQQTLKVSQSDQYKFRFLAYYRVRTGRSFCRLRGESLARVGERQGVKLRDSETPVGESQHDLDVQCWGAKMKLKTVFISLLACSVKIVSCDESLEESLGAESKFR